MIRLAVPFFQTCSGLMAEIYVAPLLIIYLNELVSTVENSRVTHARNGGNLRVQNVYLEIFVPASSNKLL